jgi:tRNA(fMet)-specific endonuclease VapC
LSDSPDRQSDIVQTFLAAFRIEPFDSAAAAHYARLRAGLQRAGTLTGPNNLVIAATALAVGGTLVTHNTKEFRRVVGLPVEDWL